MTTTKFNFYWNKETLTHFKLEASYFSKQYVVKNITTYVQNECSLEDGETEDDLIKDLTNKIYS